MSCIYLDVSETRYNKLNTGIQRVVRNLANRVEIMQAESGLPVFIVFSKQHNFYILNDLTEFNYIPPPINKELNHLNVEESEASQLRTAYKDSLYVKIKAVLKKNFKAYSVLEKIWNNLKEKIYLKRFKKVKFKKNDILVLIDSFWVDESLYQSTFFARKKGVKIICLIYDIIPLDYPRFVELNNKNRYESKIYKFLNISDGIITISKYCKDRLSSLIYSSDKVTFHGHIDFFHLGKDFFPDQSHKAQVLSSELEGLFNHKGKFGVFLMVGTIEPRKGYLFVLDVFHKYWANGGQSKLLIIGKFGWKYKKIKLAIEKSAYKGSHLIHLDRVDDELLSVIYRKSTALIMASIVEGFGLPIVEALQYGKPVIASEIPVFKEIAKDYPKYFSLSDESSLLNILEEDISSIIQYPKNKEIDAWPDWDETSKIFVNKILKFL